MRLVIAQSSRFPVGELLFALLIVAAVGVAALLVMLQVRRWLRKEDAVDPATEAFTFSDLKRLAKEGKISEEELERARTAMLARHRRRMEQTEETQLTPREIAEKRRREADASTGTGAASDSTGPDSAELNSNQSEADAEDPDTDPEPGGKSDPERERGPEDSPEDDREDRGPAGPSSSAPK